MTEKSTNYTFRTSIFGEDIERKITVPFSLEEILLLGESRNIVFPWGKNILDGPSIYRYIFTNISVPWGYSLKDRESALTSIKKTLQTITEITEMSPKPDGYTEVQGDLSSLQSNLLRFFEL